VHAHGRAACHIGLYDVGRLACTTWAAPGTGRHSLFGLASSTKLFSMTADAGGGGFRLCSGRGIRESPSNLAKSKFSVETYFDSCSRISIEGVFGGLMVRTFCCLVVVDILWTLICSLQSYSLYCPSYAIYTLKHNTLIHVPRKPEFYLGVI
jgi:hypothetical protein